MLRGTAIDPLENLKTYHYECTDKSILANKVLNPYYDWVVNLIPLWIAPNLITVCGLLCVITSYFITVNHDPELIGSAPRRIILVNAILFFLYATFDAIDGKQARRTNEKSPLGQLFDHGSDSLVCCMSSVLVCSAAGFGRSVSFYMFLFCLMIGFYCVALEEYYTGIFNLGYINGATEGVYSVILVQLITFIFGKNFWNFSKNNFLEKLFCKLLNIKFQNYFETDFATFCFLFSVGTIIYTLYNIKKYKKKRRSRRSLLQIFQLLVILGLTWSARYIFIRGYALIFFLQLFPLFFNFSILCTQTVYSHLLKEKIPMPIFSYFLYFISLSILNIRGFGIYNVIIIPILSMVSSFLYFQFVFDIVVEICNYLKINCLTITKRNKKN
ncbi:CDP-alcohol phosphatidyltransferase [Hamiltosporidium magnivora]|uniref:CDP-alcohol phosphatidyltransferase n=1 Tax=Hamiltosporidium magnivora TaxID=148818 RepID=A0A4Q9LCX2_9MICR|nr:CDP-alcohol phosphatidyltransferase [Hamiltosporidium magnivora]